MAQPNDQASEAAFLRGGGATGALIAERDWASTPLGPLSAWPPTLKTATAIVLRSPIPMAILWGPDGVMIYNDAYAEIAGGRHPQALGATLREAWSEIADFDDRIMKTVLGGETLEFCDQMLTLSRSGKPEQLWFNLDYSPVPDESGEIVGVLAVIVETTARVLAERKAAAQAERQRRMFEQAPGFIALLSGPDHVFEFQNSAHRRLFGEREAGGKARHDVFSDLPPLAFRKILDRTYATGERYVARAIRLRVRRSPDESMREVFVDFILEPVTGDAGQVTGIFVEGFEVTEQVRAQAAVEETSQRLSAAIAIACLGVFEVDLETDQVMFDARAREIYQFGSDEPLTVDCVDRRMDREDYPRIIAERGAEETKTRREREFRIHRPDGSIRDIVSVSDSVREVGGRTTRVVGVLDDVTERRRAEERQRLLINELNHRVKNTLATVQSIAAQTLRSAADVTSARDAFEARLVALAAAHDLLTTESWSGARLTDVAASAMAPFEMTQRPQISRSGPPIWLTAPRALSLSLALHELATNAAKYGALSLPEGRVRISWSLANGDELVLSWIEEGGPPVEPPTRSGFGMRLLERSLIQELQGAVMLTLAPEGVRCEIRCRIEDVRLFEAR